jgi:hypothetical protein
MVHNEITYHTASPLPSLRPASNPGFPQFQNAYADMMSCERSVTCIDTTYEAKTHASCTKRQGRK